MHILFVATVTLIMAALPDTTQVHATLFVPSPFVEGCSAMTDMCRAFETRASVTSPVITASGYSVTNEFGLCPANTVAVGVNQRCTAGFGFYQAAATELICNEVVWPTGGVPTVGAFVTNTTANQGGLGGACVTPIGVYCPAGHVVTGLGGTYHQTELNPVTEYFICKPLTAVLASVEGNVDVIQLTAGGTAFNLRHYGAPLHPGSFTTECPSNTLAVGIAFRRKIYQIYEYQGSVEMQCGRPTLLQYQQDDCSTSPCQNGGLCVDGTLTYTCDCAGTGFTGPRCQNNFDDCAAVTCQNGGTCSDGINSFQCNCNPGYGGVFCQNNINECSFAPCLNGGVCLDGINSYVCSCAGTGFVGTVCQTPINECSSSPCQNGGTCSDGINTFSCDCSGTGFNGITCQGDVNDCSLSPCQNGGTCTDLFLDYSCACEDGFTNKNCDVDINECLFSPCLNGGTCFNVVGTFVCSCPVGIVGATCDQVSEQSESTLTTPFIAAIAGGAVFSVFLGICLQRRCYKQKKDKKSVRMHRRDSVDSEMSDFSDASSSLGSETSSDASSSAFSDDGTSLPSYSSETVF